MDQSINKNNEDEIPVIYINDPYEFVSGNKTLAYIVINGKEVIKKQKLVRTKKGGHYMV